MCYLQGLEVTWLLRKQNTMKTAENSREGSWLHIFLSFLLFTTSFHLLISSSVPQTKDTLCLLCGWGPPMFNCLSVPSLEHK